MTENESSSLCEDLAVLLHSCNAKPQAVVHSFLVQSPFHQS